MFRRVAFTFLAPHGAPQPYLPTEPNLTQRNPTHRWIGFGGGEVPLPFDVYIEVFNERLCTCFYRASKPVLSARPPPPCAFRLWSSLDPPPAFRPPQGRRNRPALGGQPRVGRRQPLSCHRALLQHPAPALPQVEPGRRRQGRALPQPHADHSCAGRDGEQSRGHVSTYFFMYVGVLAEQQQREMIPRRDRVMVDAFLP